MIREAIDNMNETIEYNALKTIDIKSELSLYKESLLIRQNHSRATKVNKDLALKGILSKVFQDMYDATEESAKRNMELAKRVLKPVKTLDKLSRKANDIMNNANKHDVQELLDLIEKSLNIMKKAGIGNPNVKLPVDGRKPMHGKTSALNLNKYDISTITTARQAIRTHKFSGEYDGLLRSLVGKVDALKQILSILV